MVRTVFSVYFCRTVQTVIIYLYLLDSKNNFYLSIFVGWLREFLSVFICRMVQTVLICLYLKDGTDSFWFVCICRMVRGFFSWTLTPRFTGFPSWMDHRECCCLQRIQRWSKMLTMYVTFFVCYCKHFLVFTVYFLMA